MLPVPLPQDDSRTYVPTEHSRFCAWSAWSAVSADWFWGWLVVFGARNYSESHKGCHPFCDFPFWRCSDRPNSRTIQIISKEFITFWQIRYFFHFIFVLLHLHLARCGRDVIWGWRSHGAEHYILEGVTDALFLDNRTTTIEKQTRTL